MNGVVQSPKAWNWPTMSCGYVDSLHFCHDTDSCVWAQEEKKTTNLLLLIDSFYHVMNHTRRGKCHLHVTLNRHGHVHKGHLLREGYVSFALVQSQVCEQRLLHFCHDLDHLFLFPFGKSFWTAWEKGFTSAKLMTQDLRLDSTNNSIESWHWGQPDQAILLTAIPLKSYIRLLSVQLSFCGPS
jgi:hypothetical protein